MSSALLLALSMAAMRAPCSLAVLSSRVARKMVSMNRGSRAESTVWGSVRGDTARPWALPRAVDLHGEDAVDHGNLGEGRAEVVVDDVERVDLALLVLFGGLAEISLGHAGEVGQGDPEELLVDRVAASWPIPRPACRPRPGGPVRPRCCARTGWPA